MDIRPPNVDGHNDDCCDPVTQDDHLHYRWGSIDGGDQQSKSHVPHRSGDRYRVAHFQSRPANQMTKEKGCYGGRYRDDDRGMSRSLLKLA